VLTATVAACGGGDDDDDAASAAATDDASVTIELVAFKPPELSVDAGATVTWTNEDPGAHTVTSGTVEQDATGAAATSADGTFASGQLENGKTFSFSFDEPGTYAYFCEIHPATMRGEIQVR
jgi:plastocyanin